MNTWFNGLCVHPCRTDRMNIQIKELCFDKLAQNLFKSSQFELKLINLALSRTPGNCNVNHLQTKLEKTNRHGSFTICFFEPVKGAALLFQALSGRAGFVLQFGI